MNLTIINGSPRGEESNTRILLDHFAKGFLKAAPDNHIEIHYLGRSSIMANPLEAFNNAEYCLIGFPLYTDAMPGSVKYFIEQLKDSQGKKLLFFIQGGFPEAVHYVVIKQYVERLTQRLGADYLGTIIKGGVEGIKDKPLIWTRKLRNRFYRLGYRFGKNGKLDERLLQKLSQPHKMGNFKAEIMIKLNRTGLFNLYWNHYLKKNNAFDKRFDQPYQKTRTE